MTAASEEFTQMLADLTPTPASYLRVARRVAAGEVEGLRVLKLGVLSSFTASFLEPYLRVEGARWGLDVRCHFAPWGQLEAQACDFASELHVARPDAVVVLAQAEDLGADAVGGRMREIVAGLRRHGDARIFVANFAPPARLPLGLADAGSGDSAVGKWHLANDAVASACSNAPDAYVFDLARVAMIHGLAKWEDARMLHMARMPYPAVAQIAIGRALARTLKAGFVEPSKVLVLDLDGTLWGGVVGEEGVGGIALGDEYPGNVFKEWQRYLLSLRDRGVLLAICSKNNPSDVDEVFERHSDMVLKREHFAAVRVNWEAKSENLRSIAAELRLGLDSFVFLDDSAFEREEVRAAVPEVKVLEFPASPLGLIAAVEECGFFDRLTVTEEDRQRAGRMRQQEERREAASKAGPDGDFMESLGLVATIGTVDDATLARVAQLLAKTNQFNLTTRRHGAADVKRMLDEGAVALWLRLSDRFGDHGLVGVAITVREKGNDDAWRIDSLLLSCRVIGRGAEDALVSRLAQTVLARGARVLRGEYVATAKNGIVANFYERLGFRPAGPGSWEWIVGDPEVALPKHLLTLDEHAVSPRQRN